MWGLQGNSDGGEREGKHWACSRAKNFEPEVMGRQKDMGL